MLTVFQEKKEKKRIMGNHRGRKAILRRMKQNEYKVVPPPSRRQGWETWFPCIPSRVCGWLD